MRGDLIMSKRIFLPFIDPIYEDSYNFDSLVFGVVYTLEHIKQIFIYKMKRK